jgi:hypothetical protein
MLKKLHRFISLNNIKQFHSNYAPSRSHRPMTIKIFFQPSKGYSLRHTNSLLNKIRKMIWRMRMKMRVIGKMMMSGVTKKSNSKEQRGLRCRWGLNSSFNSKMKLSMHLRNYWEKNSDCTEDLKASNLVNGMNSKIYPTSTIEFSFSSIIIKPIKLLSETTYREDSHILDSM